ncbi:hypothetical protein ACTGYQ_07295, partial [Streptococcus suis]
HMSLSNVSVVAFHYRSYGTFCIYSKRLHNLYSGFTHYRNYRAFILWVEEFFVWHSSQFDNIHKLFDKNYYFFDKDTCQKEKEVLQ